jgi:hypothetical protein
VTAAPSRWRWGRRAAVGLAVAAVYVLSVALTVGRAAPPRLLFDGFVPTAPYNWVNPPPQLTSTNKAPQSGEGEVALSEAGSAGLSVATGDAQASIVAPEGAFPPKPGQTSIHVTITPMDPAEVGSPPAGKAFDGNAYEFTAQYQPSGEDAPLQKRASILLRYPIHTTVILRRTETGWSELKTTIVTGTLQVFAGTTQLGTFVGAAPKQGRGLGWLPYISIGAIALAGLAGLAVRWRESRSRRR